ncbi:hypothetical protein AVEN_272761-1 [Araneus ventricosus]|uniref:Uncharacterized protein n=1 Tax=Araneus ventricosus TaxID=182803 RepID=A0A4Y2TR40_ARAVE|nr:hypothetical protein AVEN_272761-1 [Araneus ventricosus]
MLSSESAHISKESDAEEDDAERLSSDFGKPNTIFQFACDSHFREVLHSSSIDQEFYSCFVRKHSSSKERQKDSITSLTILKSLHLLLKEILISGVLEQWVFLCDVFIFTYSQSYNFQVHRTISSKKI